MQSFFLALLFSVLPLILSRPLLFPRADSPATPFLTAVVGEAGNSTTPINMTSADESSLLLPQAAALSAAAYCNSVRSGNWTCPFCSIVPDVQLLWMEGDGDETPKVYVGYSAGMNAMIVGHEGTEKEIDPWLTDLDALPADLDKSLNNGNASEDVQVHEGFQGAYLNSSVGILQAVQGGLSGVGSSADLVLVTGHSMGAAVGILSALHLRINLPVSLPIQFVGFGQPRVGSPEFVDYVESVMGENYVHVTNDNDIVPRVPGTFLGYSDLQNEIWINGNGTVAYCPGVENESCAAGVDETDLSASPHDGPYFGSTMDSHCDNWLG